jgi:hypothetical protein
MNTNSEFQWRNELRKLGGPVEPAQELWPQIQARIQAPPRQRARWPRVAAAAAVLVMAGGAGVLAWHQRAAQLAEQDTPSTPLEWAQPDNPKLLAAAQDLDSASANLQQALERHPDAVFLVGLLNRTNSQRIRLMQAPYAG